MSSVSIIIPAYNEEKRLPPTLKQIQNYISEKNLEHEIIIVSDGSTDNTAGAAENFPGLNIRVIENKKHRGKGYCVNTGVSNAQKDIILFSDADMSTPIKYLDDFLALHENGFDVVIASRALNRKIIKQKQPFIRDHMGRFFNFLARKITGLEILDTQCGFKSFRKNAAKHIFSRQTIFDFGFDVEILYIAKLH
ncbi:MAG: dolichyl-phosphate beta-glucosyltransferase, partial [bacterium]